MVVVFFYFEKEDFLRILRNIESRYLQLKSDKIATLENDYLKNLYRLDESHLFEIKNQKITFYFLFRKRTHYLYFMKGK